MLAYATPAKAMEKPCGMCESTACESLLAWCRGVHKCFQFEYLREIA